MDHAELDLTPVATAAAELVRPGMTIGLGTGHAATAFVYALAKRVNAGLQVRGVPTSESVALLARELGIQLVTLNEAPRLDIDFDGADEVAPDSTLIKGYGGALVREKIVAAAADRLVILVGPEKLVPKVGHARQTAGRGGAVRVAGVPAPLRRTRRAGYCAAAERRAVQQ